MRHFFIAICCIYLITGCTKKQSDTNTRSFYMGVTPWPADCIFDEINNANNFINNQCDIVSHHFDDGIPYEEAFTNQPFPAAFLQDVLTGKTKTNPGIKIFLSVSALNLTRKEKSGYYKESTFPDSIKNKWKNLPVNDPNVVTAYINYISWLIDQLQPVFVNYGVESNFSRWNASACSNYRDFISKVYPQLKSKYPLVPFFIRFIVDESAEGYRNAQQLVPYTDYIALSAYPYVTVSSSANGSTNPVLFADNYF